MNSTVILAKEKKIALFKWFTKSNCSYFDAKTNAKVIDLCNTALKIRFFLLFWKSSLKKNFFQVY